MKENSTEIDRESVILIVIHWYCYLFIYFFQVSVHSTALGKP